MKYVAVLAHATAGSASWGLMALITGLVALYCCGASRIRARKVRWSVWRVASFALGAGLVICALAPPLVTAAAHSPVAHVMQHLLLGMAAPLGLVLGAPVTLALRNSGTAVRRRAARVLRSPAVHLLSHPVTAAAVAVGGMYGLYLTPVYSLSTTTPWLHAAIHAHVLISGYLFCWAIAGTDPGPRRASIRTRAVVLGSAIAAHATLAKAMYAHGWAYGTGQDPDDLRRAAELLYYGGDAMELLLAVALFGQWYRSTGRRSAAAKPDRRVRPTLLDPQLSPPPAGHPAVD
jgi:putative membrane protein